MHLEYPMDYNNSEDFTFRFPHSLLAKIYDLTGTVTGGNKGFVISYVNSEGDPSVLYKFENNTVKAALFDCMSGFLERRDMVEQIEAQNEEE